MASWSFLTASSTSVTLSCRLLWLKITGACKKPLTCQWVPGSSHISMDYSKAVELRCKMTWLISCSGSPLCRTTADLGVASHDGQTLGRVVGVHGHIGRAGLQDGQEAGEELQAAPHQDAHRALGARAQLDEVVRQLVGPRIQLPKAQSCVLQVTDTS